MSMLFDGLPTAIKVKDKICAINYDYRTCLKIIAAYEDPELTAQEKSVILLNLLYKDSPDDIQEGINQGTKFLDCGESPNAGSSAPQERRYSFVHDEKYIFAAVNTVLQGRLGKNEDIHWWEFVSAFLELPENSMMSQIISLRSRQAKNKLTKEEQKLWSEMRDVLELPDTETSEETEARNEFLRLLGKD